MIGVTRAAANAFAGNGRGDRSLPQVNGWLQKIAAVQGRRYKERVMRQLEEQTAPHLTASLSPWRIGAIATSAAACLALLTALQTYLTMLSHGHSFARLLLWHFGCFWVWAIAAPWIVRLSGYLPTRRLVGIGLALTLTHTLAVAQLAMWIQPFFPAISADFSHALWHLAWFFALVDPLVVGVLIVCGRSLAAYERARQLALRESQLEGQLARAQLDALRLEIQPHFLFNTLNSMAALIRANDNTAALSMLLGLSDVMRDTLDRTDRQVAPLGRELELIRKYVELQRARFGDRLQVRYEIDRASERCTIPVLLLQPLVENALRHGLAPRARGGELVVGARLESPELLRVWVSDDGVGLPAGFDLSRDAGTGLANTRARLGHLYEARADLTVTAAPGGGTIAEIVMPVTASGVLRLPESGAA
jgi:signal transduction histidine kinase